MTTRNRGGWYLPAADGGQPRKSALWTYTFKNTDDDLKTGKNLPPPLEEGLQTRFDPGDQPFGLWVSNDYSPTAEESTTTKETKDTKKEAIRQNQLPLETCGKGT